MKLKLLTLCVATLCSMPMLASAHGYPITPLARQASCANDGGFWWPADGSGIPNQACRAAFEKETQVSPGNPQYPFVQANEFSARTIDYRNIDAVKVAVPNGLLCSGGDSKKSGMDVPSPYWKQMPLKTDASGKFDLTFYATMKHDPSFWEVYLSKPGFDPATQQLTWENLDKIASYENIQATGSNYVLPDIQLPRDRIGGRAVIYTRWQRIDSAGEGFYNCSDVNIQTPGSASPTPLAHAKLSPFAGK
jgi:predicted carbohydrate-binding protein with CBM5 and CBM33 domain